MYSSIQFKTTAPIISIAFALACFALSPEARAVTPAPDGGYPLNNTAEGTSALFSLNGGLDNTAIGDSALYFNTTGNGNTAIGTNALLNNKTADSNTATGAAALFHNTTGTQNTATGVSALQNNTTASNNTANGFQALKSNTTGFQNTATGVNALLSNTTGGNNTANGLQALASNTTGGANTANGVGALFSNGTGFDNTANGVQALAFNTTGHDNTAEGLNALVNNTGGSNNIALGASAGSNLTAGSNNIDIGNGGVAGESGRIRIGTAGKQTDTLIAGIYGKTIASGAQVIIGSGGKLGTIQSSARFKEAIKLMDKASEAILALKPVTFRYKHELDPDGIPQFGLVAEQVEKVNPDLVVRDEDGKVNTVRYEAVNAMLLNEFLKEHRKVEEQEATIRRLKNSMEVLTATVKEQALQIQKVSDRVELSQPTPQMAANNQ